MFEVVLGTPRHAGKRLHGCTPSRGKAEVEVEAAAEVEVGVGVGVGMREDEVHPLQVVVSVPPLVSGEMEINEFPYRHLLPAIILDTIVAWNDVLGTETADFGVLQIGSMEDKSIGASFVVRLGTRSVQIPSTSKSTGMASKQLVNGSKGVGIRVLRSITWRYQQICGPLQTCISAQ
ncbi:ATP synthase subunit delta [Bienertia sinuspersici]